MAKVALQLYSVRYEMLRDPLGTIEKVAEIGFRYLEVANHNTTWDKGIGFGVPADKMCGMLDRLGVRVISAHLDPLEDLDALADYQLTIGNRNVVFSRDYYRSRDEVLARARWMNKMGEECAKRGLTLHYHNHFHEFLKFGGETIFHILRANMDPYLVKIELDTYWALRGGADPAELLKKLGKRVLLVHQKDYPEGYEDDLDLTKKVAPGEYVDRSFYDRHENPDTFTEIGTGIMDIQGIIDAGNASGGLEYIILEQDYSKLGQMESVRVSKANFGKYRGIEW